MHRAGLISKSTAPSKRSPDLAFRRPPPLRGPAIGNQAALRALRHDAPSAPFIQRKLEVGAADDPLEHEADRAAEQVMRMPEQQGISIEGSPDEFPVADDAGRGISQS